MSDQFNLALGINKMKLYYLSFADTKKPRGTQWLGCAYVEAESLPHATLHELVRHGCNPGGEVMSIELPIDAPIKQNYRNRLLNEEELRESSGCGDRVLLDMDGNEIEEKS